MGAMIYFIISLLFAIYFYSIWNGTKEFENIITRISFITICTLFVTFITYILLMFSSIGIDSPNEEVMKGAKKIIMLVFVPLNGFLTVPRIINLINRLKNMNISNEEKERKFQFLGLIILGLLIIECIYFKKIQTGIIEFINLRQ